MLRVNGEPRNVEQVGSVRGVVHTFFNKAWVKVKAVMAKFAASLDTGKVDLAEVARVWQLWSRHRLPAEAVVSMRSEASLEVFSGGVEGINRCHARAPIGGWS